MARRATRDGEGLFFARASDEEERYAKGRQWRTAFDGHDAIRIKTDTTARRRRLKRGLQRIVLAEIRFFSLFLRSMDEPLHKRNKDTYRSLFDENIFYS